MALYLQAFNQFDNKVTKTSDYLINLLENQTVSSEDKLWIVRIILEKTKRF